MSDPVENLLAQVKGLLRRFELKTKKRLGQHFLIDESVLQQIVSAAELTREDVVVEVGPGLGLLTRELAKRADKVIAVELDAQLVVVLKRTLSNFGNIFIVHADILEVSPSELTKRYSGTTHYKVVANLPYYITSPVLRHFLEASFKPELMVLMVQKEVGEAIAASSGRMSLLSISVQFYAKPSVVAYVPASSFYPEPKVDSMVLRLDLLPEPAVVVSDVAGFFDVVRGGFSSPRKQLRNSLAQGLKLVPAQAALLLGKAEIDPQRRAETLGLEEWARIWEVWNSSAKGLKNADCFGTG